MWVPSTDAFGIITFYFKYQLSLCKGLNKLLLGIEFILLWINTTLSYRCCMSFLFCKGFELR